MPAFPGTGSTLVTGTPFTNGAVVCAPLAHTEGLAETVERYPASAAPGTVRVDADRPAGRGVGAAQEDATWGAA